MLFETSNTARPKPSRAMIFWLTGLVPTAVTTPSSMNFALVIVRSMTMVAPLMTTSPETFSVP
jgi:hypothetical protein